MKSGKRSWKKLHLDVDRSGVPVAHALTEGLLGVLLGVYERAVVFGRFVALRHTTPQVGIVATSHEDGRAVPSPPSGAWSQG